MALAGLYWPLLAVALPVFTGRCRPPRPNGASSRLTATELVAVGRPGWRRLCRATRLASGSPFRHQMDLFPLGDMQGEPGDNWTTCCRRLCRATRPATGSPIRHQMEPFPLGDMKGEPGDNWTTCWPAVLPGNTSCNRVTDPPPVWGTLPANSFCRRPRFSTNRLRWTGTGL